MTETSHAVFLSYASQDAEAAQKICEALRSGGVEVWFDRSELRGGDAWDRSIRQQIRDCALFVPVVSQHTHERLEGYFRREWRLAVERAGDMADNRAFFVPVVIDGTTERDPSVPEKFRELQWTRLPGGETPPAFVERVRRLLSPQVPGTAVTGAASAAVPATAHALKSRRTGPALAAVVAVAVVAVSGYVAVDRFLVAGHAVPTTAAQTPAPAPAAFNPPPHSVAVLPFVNMSGDKEQEYFSEGLTEELLNSLSQINDLQVAARTSSFSFREHTDIGTVARKLNVAAVLEGSVRRSAHTVRVTAQLINAVSGFHLWSKTYDRDLGDVLRLQTEIASAVAEALKVTLLGDLAARIELGGTRNPAALDVYLRASRAFSGYARAAELQTVIAGYSEAIRHDPGYVLAFANRSVAFASYARNYAAGPAVQENYARAQADAQKAITLAPGLAEAHLALATVLRDSLDFRRASEEYQRAVALAPGNARVLGEYGVFAVEMGQAETGLAAVRRALVLDPLSADAHRLLGDALTTARRDSEAIEAFTAARALAPNDGFTNAWLGFTYYQVGDFENARTACAAADESNKAICLALVYEKLGRTADAQQQLSQLRARYADAGAIFYSMIHAQWGDKPQALQWLEVARRHRDPYLIKVKMNAFFDPLRSEPRFQAIERELKFPA
ncbi:MAG: TIR domain-containing protein [Proteobacteria bacterium]|nr:TIR domain-containing protein [Pseudomonadota bacterium]